MDTKPDWFLISLFIAFGAFLACIIIGELGALGLL